MPQSFNYIDFSDSIRAQTEEESRLSSEKYTTQEFMKLEWEHIWTKTWLFAGLESDLNEVGDFFVYDIGRESIVVTRNEKKGLSAFYNACQHRGNKLLSIETGCVKKVSCPYHGWTYDLEGKLQFVPDRELFQNGVSCNQRSLKTVQISSWAGLIFINMCEDSASLEDFLGPIIKQLSPYHFENMVLVKHQSLNLEANWKTVRDNFLEQYHVDFIHPQHASFVDCCDAENDMWPFGHSRTSVESPVINPRYQTPEEPPEFMINYLRGLQLNPDDFKGKVSEIRKAIQKQKRIMGKKLGFDYSEFTDDQISDVFQYDIFPNIFMTIHPERMWLYGPKPDISDPNKCNFTKLSFQIPKEQIIDSEQGIELLPGSAMYQYSDLRAKHETFTREDVIEGRESLTITIDQDIHYLNDMQAGMHSRGFDAALLNNDEGRVQHFHNWIDNWISDKPLWSEVNK